VPGPRRRPRSGGLRTDATPVRGVTGQRTGRGGGGAAARAAAHLRPAGRGRSAHGTVCIHGHGAVRTHGAARLAPRTAPARMPRGAA
jgi:hypothetical protein